MLFALLALAVPLAAARAASTAADHARFLEAFGSLDGTLERVKPDGTPQCGDSVKLKRLDISTCEEAKLPIRLISLVKAMGMEPECPTVFAAVDVIGSNGVRMVRCFALPAPANSGLRYQLAPARMRRVG